MSDKVYTLPDLPASATGDSELQTMVRQLIEYADFSTLVPIVDKLREQDRNRDLRHLQAIISGVISNVNGNKVYAVFVHQLLGVFWFDLFDVAGTAAVLAKVEFAPTTRQQDRLTATDASAEEVNELRRYRDEMERRRRAEEAARRLRELQWGQPKQRPSDFFDGNVPEKYFDNLHRPTNTEE